MTSFDPKQELDVSSTQTPHGIFSNIQWLKR